MIYFINDTYYLIKKHYLFLTQVYQEIKKFLKIKDDDHITIKFSSKKQQKKLINQFYKNHRSFNVLTFPYEDKTCIKNNINYLGDISICLKVIKQDAKRYNNSFLKELSYIFIHSILHLYHFDHQEKEEAKIMQKLTTKILTIFNL